ncbi:tRNA (guanine(26)-N(2))-dimethyltransferase-like [Tubulanus polymorphus]|uniref:tRNA (guanine(26)-N(2))-dimethyltransferase-like n=1 Tax=Tubulanus polymorphus TaxID=672921 RepID=UPI003DA2F61B
MLRITAFRCSCFKHSKFLKRSSSLGYRVQMASTGPSAETDNVVSEGKARIFSPKTVFYNPVQEFNRDLTISVITEFAKQHFDDLQNGRIKGRKPKSVEAEEAKLANAEELECGKYYPNGLRILEGLAATGLRSVRFALEIPGVKEIVSNDFDENAVGYIAKNIEMNSVERLMKANCGDASMVMYRNRKVSDQFDVIDLDPYGSPSPFLDSAVQAVRDGGLLCITATDMAVLSGNHGETCFTKYGSMAIRSKACHEQALRVLLQSIQSHAARYGRYIEPVISVSVDFYIRVFARVFSAQSKAKMAVSKLAMVYQCVGCETYTLQPLGLAEPHKGSVKFAPGRGPPVDAACAHCNHAHILGGPIWSAPLHDMDFVRKLIASVHQNSERFQTANRIIGMMTVVSEELPDVPLYYLTDGLCSTLHVTAISLVTIRSAIMNAGYDISMSHAQKNSIKTNAPMSVIWDIMRCWAKQNPVNERHLVEGSVTKAILSKEPAVQASFELHADANPQSREKGLVRWQLNPEKDWGPKSRAKKFDGEESMTEKRSKQQGKRKGPHSLNTEENRYKNFPCKRFKNGECDLGTECKYNHEEQYDDDK